MTTEIVYVRYDGVEMLLTTRDEAGQLYLHVFVDEADEVEGYDSLFVALPLSDARYAELEEGKLNLRQAFLEPEAGELVMISNWPDGSTKHVFLPASEVFFQYLPGPVPLPRRRSMV
jgi:hypothetical protein